MEQSAFQEMERWARHSAGVSAAKITNVKYEKTIRPEKDPHTPAFTIHHRGPARAQCPARIRAKHNLQLNGLENRHQQQFGGNHDVWLCVGDFRRHLWRICHSAR